MPLPASTFSASRSTVRLDAVAAEQHVLTRQQVAWLQPPRHDVAADAVDDLLPQIFL